MNSIINFNNPIKYMVVSPTGEIIQRGQVQNAVGARLKDQLSRAMGFSYGTPAGTVLQITGMGFRTDGSAILGSFAQWFAGATCAGTVYNTATYSNSIMLAGTYTATANVSVKSAILYSLAANLTSPSLDVGSFCYAYSTQFNMSCGSGGLMIIQWTVNVL
jgi:hypothetical protein